MIDEELAKTFVFRNERLKSLWEIGPTHKCALTQLIDDVVRHINNGYDDDTFQDFLVRNKLYIFLNTIDLEVAVKELSFALANYMDGDKDHDIQSNTGLDKEDCVRIAQARKLAKEVLGW